MSRIAGLTKNNSSFFNEEQTTAIWCFIGYVLMLLQMFVTHDTILGLFISTLACIIIILAMVNYLALKRINSYKQNVKERAKNLTKEIIMYLPVLAIQLFVVRFIITDLPSNQVALNEMFLKDPIMIFIEAVILAPIYEEIIFRYYPSKFIKNIGIYVITSGTIFAYLHVAKDEKWMIFICAYLISSLYYSYRYVKTQNITVPVALHRFNNLVCVFCIMMSVKN